MFLLVDSRTVFFVCPASARNGACLKEAEQKEPSRKSSALAAGPPWIHSSTCFVLL